MVDCSRVYQRWIKHAKLISNCYPSLAGETGPKKAELAYLVFYAQSRPAKLTKCGAYLEKRVAADVRKRKKQDIEVSLEILKALLKECNSNINLFSKNILQIIQECLNTYDIDLVSHATSLFITFCGYHDGSTLGNDIEFTKLYEDLVARFAEFCVDTNENNSELAQRYHSIGLHAIQGVTTSEALYGSDSEQQLRFIIPAILHNLTDSETGLEFFQKNDADPQNEDIVSPQARRFSINMGTTSNQENARLAYHCLKQLFKSATQTNIHSAMKPTFTFLDKNDMWWPSSFGVSLILIILSILQAQHRYALVNTILQRLNSYSDAFNPTTRIVTLVEMLSSILISRLELLNLAIGDVLECLLEFLLKTLKNGDNITNDNIKEKNDNVIAIEENLQNLILQGLVKSIGGLATHVYYSTQIQDIMVRIIQCMQLRAGSESSGQSSSDSSITEGIPITKLRQILLKCLYTVIQCNNEVEKFPNKPRNQVPVEIFQDTVELCLDADLGVRIAYSKVLTKLFENDQSRRKMKESNGENPEMFNQHVIHFLNTLHLSLYQYALSPNAQPPDHIALSGILRALLIRFRGDQIIRGVPVLFRLQADAMEEKLEDFARQRSIASIIAQYFHNIATILEISELTQYIEQIQKERAKKHQTSAYIEPSSYVTTATLEELDQSIIFDDETSSENPPQPVDVWLDREFIISILSQHQDLKDIGGSDLELKLSSGWKPEEGVEDAKSKAYRIRSSKNLDDIKPSFTPPPIMIYENPSGELQKPIIKVEQLRDALYTPVNNDSSDHETSVASETRKTKKSNSNVNEYLNSLGVKSASTNSLVNPPYRTQ